MSFLNLKSLFRMVVPKRPEVANSPERSMGHKDLSQGQLTNLGGGNDPLPTRYERGPIVSSAVKEFSPPKDLMQRAAAVQIHKDSKQSYLDMVPDEHRRHVRSIARDAYTENGHGRDWDDFLEAIALSWLQVKDLFLSQSEDDGFHAVDYLYQNQVTSAILLTRSGSLVALAKPDERGARFGAYVPVKLRIGSRLQPKENNNVYLMRSINTYSFDTVWIRNLVDASPVIGIVISDQASVDQLLGSANNMGDTMLRIIEDNLTRLG